MPRSYVRTRFQSSSNEFDLRGFHQFFTIPIEQIHQQDAPLPCFLPREQSADSGARAAKQTCADCSPESEQKEPQKNPSSKSGPARPPQITHMQGSSQRAWKSSLTTQAPPSLAFFAILLISAMADNNSLVRDERTWLPLYFPWLSADVRVEVQCAAAHDVCASGLPPVSVSHLPQSPLIQAELQTASVHTHRGSPIHLRSLRHRVQTEQSDE